MKKLLTSIIFITTVVPAFAQSDVSAYVKTVEKFVDVKYDTSYVHDLSKMLTLRVYGSKDYIDYSLQDNGYSDKVDYKANTTPELGLGASYKFFGFNAGFKTPFINRHDTYGQTKYVDLSSHFYLPKFTLDVYGSNYSGYYMNNGVDFGLSPGTYLRPDLNTGFVGVSAQYILTAKKFSYMGAFSQMQYQKKSAGSFIFGAGIYTEFIRADSAIVPAALLNNDFFNSQAYNKSAIYSLTVNGGYAYTLVVKQYYFLSGSLNLGAGMNYTTFKNTGTYESDNKLEPQLNADYRLATGYNSDEYYISAQYIRLLNKSYTPIPGTRQDFGEGDYRIIFAKRFKLKKHNVIEKTMNKAGLG